MTTEATSREVGSHAGLGLYPERDHAAQGEHYLRHIDAMTRDGLHAKSRIAGELAARDIEIERLREAMTRCVESVERWLRTDEAASPEESRSIYEQMCAALGREPVDPNALTDEEAADCGLLSELKGLTF